MKSKNIPLAVTDIVKFANQYLSIFDAFNHLSKGEKDVLSLIMTHKNSFIKDDEIREKLLLDYDVKMDTSRTLNVTEARLNNIISNLRKKNALIKTKHGNKLHEAYDIREITLPFDLTFSWDAEIQK